MSSYRLRSPINHQPALNIVYSTTNSTLAAADSSPQPAPPRLPADQDASPGDMNGSGWSAAVGRAANGKSGRVIERLMGDNDRLQREMAFARAQVDEESKRSELARSTLESVRASNEHLRSMHDTDQIILARRDRKIEELREEVKSERLQKEHAETEVNDTRAERDNIVQKLTRESVHDREVAKKSTVQYDVLVKCWKGLEERYERQVRQLTASAKTLREKQAEDQLKISKIDVVMEQLRREGEKSQSAKEHLARDFEAYKQQQEYYMQKQVEEFQTMKDRALENEDKNEKLAKELAAALGEMRYVVNLTKNFKGSD